ncbi:PPOX class F420-dependent oxidoreductase [Nocardia transvalensis]|uniref:PPOX class F420-dependent oxidoreductase n=1 Tax=Nocardia transvalensis TaxID=37333 RepID=UPI0018942DD0|nr:PPOX class F420-dependent oxidoreductase [Nocardia transvalensis]MBF6330484.1 PPOX class F420-dependent oxidoreductase [Nocardia transvalensis]
MLSLADPEVREFLTFGTRTCKLAFVATDGRPVINPVWFVLEGDEVVFTTGKDSAKGRAILRDPRVAVCVDREETPFGYVQIQGVAALSEDLDEMVRLATAIGRRYMGADRAEEFGRRNGVPGELLVRVRPVKVLGSLDLSG